LEDDSFPFGIPSFRRYVRFREGISKDKKTIYFGMGKKMHWEDHLGVHFFQHSSPPFRVFLSTGTSKDSKVSSGKTKKTKKLQVATKQKMACQPFFKQPIFSNLGS